MTKRDLKFVDCSDQTGSEIALRDNWNAAWNDAKLVVSSLLIEVKLSWDRSITVRKRTRFHEEDAPDENVNEVNEADESPEATNSNTTYFM